MKTQTPGAVFASKVAARIREFCSTRGMSFDTLVRAAKLSAAEIQLLHAESEDMTRDMLERIAAVLGVHPAALCMAPDEHAVASLLEAQRDLPRDEFQKLAGELVSKGFFRSKGLA